MLSMAAVGSAAGAASYFAKDNYYTSTDAVETSAWEGKGAASLGLAGAVEFTPFEKLMEGELPGGTRLQAGVDGKHRAGLDMTFSAPKSLSLLAYIGGDKRLLEANMRAVKATMAWAEKNLAETRMQVGGRMQTVRTGNLVMALFAHDTSRALDPQAHVHAVIANATQGPDGKWRSLHNDKLWQNNTLLGAIYHAYLRGEVEKLGYEIGKVGKNGTFEIAGVSREAVEAFSQRRQQIVEIAKDFTYKGPEALREVTVRSRDRKEPVEDRGALHAGWVAKAEGLGLNLAALVEAARERGASGNVAWSRVVEGVSGIVDRGRALAGHFASIVGGPSSDPLLPEHPWRLKPGELASAQAVASAIRHLSQREASFQTNDVYRTALGFGLPVTIEGVESRVDYLTSTGALIKGKGPNEGFLTTLTGVRLEERIVELAAEGRGRSAPILSPDEARTRVQAAAAERGGIAMNPGQEGAGTLILASHDRVVNVQGVAGAGKSTVLAALAQVGREEGRNVIGLAFQNKMVRDLSASGIESTTIASFLGSHRKLMQPGTFAEKIDFARAQFRGAVIVVDEASMVSNVDKERLIALANFLEVDRLAFVGDKRQLGAIDAGKPFEVLQKTGTETAVMAENLRQRDPVLKAAADAANAGQVRRAVETLRPVMVEAGPDSGRRAAEAWLSLDAGDRERTAIFASGRAIRNEVNELVQQGRAERGELGSAHLDLRVRDRIGITREEERYVDSYEPGMLVDFRQDLPAQGIGRGTATVMGVDRKSGTVTLRGADGKDRTFRPEKLSPHRRNDSLQLAREKALRIREGDRIRWTDTDKKRGLLNSDQAKVLSIGKDGVTVETSTKGVMTLPSGDPMLSKLDLAYAINAHMAQGVTADRGIAVMDSRERNLTNEKLFLVTITRVRDGLTMFVDSVDRVGKALERNRGEKTSSLETIGSITPDARPAPAAAPRTRSSEQPAPASDRAASTPTDKASATPKPELERAPSLAKAPAKQIEMDL